MATDGEAPDYYELLCVEPNATKDDIRKAYRRQALLFHPDKMKPHMQDEASQHFQLISEAYEVLSDGMSLLSYCSWLVSSRIFKPRFSRCPALIVFESLFFTFI